MRCEVAVVGGGPAGAATALRLARAGVDVRIVEQARFPRTKACGEYLSAGAVAQLAALGLGVDRMPNAAPVCGIRLFGNGTHAQLEFTEPGWSCPRATLDDRLLQAAREAGAELLLGRATDCRNGRDAVQLDVRDDAGRTCTIEANIVVAADGARSTIARALDLSEHAVPRNARFAIGGHFSGLRELDGHIEMFVDGTTYFAVNPLGADRANVMLIAPRSDMLAHRDDIDSFLRERALRLTRGRCGFDRAALEGARIAIGPLYHRARGVTAHRTLLAGDAAHFLDPFTGQGVYLALRTAVLCSEAVLRRRSGIPEEQAWREYDRAVRAEIAHRRQMAALVSLLIRVKPLSRVGATIVRSRPHIVAPLLNALTGAA